MEAQASAHTDRHVAIAGEVEVDLHRKCQDANPRSRCRQRCQSIDKKLVDDFRKLIGYYHLLTQTYKETIDTLGHIFDVDTTVVNLFCHSTIAHNRTCHKLWEH